MSSVFIPTGMPREIVPGNCSCFLESVLNARKRGDWVHANREESTKSSKVYKKSR